MWFKQIRVVSLLLVLVVGVVPALFAAQPPAAAIASAHPLATQAGLRILKQGGNAFDAAITVTAMLAVVEPAGSGIGGGGFWLLHETDKNNNTMIDGRERAPLAAHRNMYLDKQGQPVADASLNGPLAAGIPGEPAALVYLAEHYGRLPLSKTLEPAIRAARLGFPVGEHYRRMVGMRKEVLLAHGAGDVFLDRDAVPKRGWVLRQPQLARTLEMLASKGRAGFYEGELAAKLVNGVQKAGGIWSLNDLKSYKVKERKPVSASYNGFRISSAALPSSGGIVLAQMLNMLSGFELSSLDPVKRQHLVIESMRLAYRDRARYLGDKDYIKVSEGWLTSKDYADLLRKRIDTISATPSVFMSGKRHRPKGNDTSHFSVIDKEGNRVAATLSVNYPFGSGFMASGTGVVLNNEMDDFSIKPGVPNVYGLVGNEANAIAPGKRPLSSMSPTFIENDDGVLIIGTPGGSRIITMVLLAALEMMEGRGSVKDWVSLPRYHHQYLPDVVTIEPGAMSAVERSKLEAMGHTIKERESTYGNMHAVYWDKKKDKVEAASDPRGEGMAVVVD
ncbi:MAG: gamma-glutamyltransferase [Proteobacteria bacterium]|nr:gamma-glutamyltransferase [Pseudomonadota bacterium]